MDPNSGRILGLADLKILQEKDPEEAAKFSVRLEGTQEEIEQIASAVQRDLARREANRRKNKAARKARRATR